MSDPVAETHMFENAQSVSDLLTHVIGAASTSYEDLHRSESTGFDFADRIRRDATLQLARLVAQLSGETAEGLFLKNTVPEPFVANDTLVWEGPLGTVSLLPGCRIRVVGNVTADGDCGDAIVMAQCLLAAAQRIY